MTHDVRDLTDDELMDAFKSSMIYMNAERLKQLLDELNRRSILPKVPYEQHHQ